MTLYIIALMYRNTKAHCTELADCFDEVSHDQFTRLLHKPRPWQKLLWRTIGQAAVLRGGYLILDDTVLDKFGTAIFGVHWVYCSRLQKVVRGLNLVVLLWTDGKRRLPIAIKLWRKGEKSKVELASQLLRRAHWLGVQPDYVLMDSWYSASQLLQQIDGYGWNFITLLKKNRKLKDRLLKQHWPHRFGHAQGKLACGVEVLVVKDGKRYLTTNALSLSVQEVKRQYGKRQQIEEFFKVMRDQLRWQQCSARSEAAQLAHLHLCVLAYCILEAEAVKQGTTVYKVRRCLYRQEVPKQSPLLQPFIRPA